jgi:phosphate transport system protein
MTVHMHREIERLKKDVLALCALAEEQVQLAVAALVERNPDRAEAIIDRDREIDRREVEIEDACLKILALFQPVAVDLRFLVMILKINSDLERIGDLAVNVARKAIAYAATPPMQSPFDLECMAQKAQSMLHDSLDALVNMDAELAGKICDRDDEVDRLKHDIRLRAEAIMRDNPERVTPLLTLLGAARNLERIADHATNIAEDVIYMVDGRIIRHGRGL